MNPSWKKYAAELIGTFVLVLFGCGSAATAGGELGTLGVALAFGLAFVAMAYVIGAISGCHINPAVSLAMLVVGKLSAKDFIGYVIAQAAGAVAGAGLLYAIIDSAGKTVTTLGENGYGSGFALGISEWMAIVVEVVLTFVLVYVVMASTGSAGVGSLSGVVIGLTLALVHIFGIGLTGTSVNPARSFGPAIIQGGDALSHLWVFIVAPAVGAVIAAFGYKWLNNGK